MKYRYLEIGILPYHSLSRQKLTMSIEHRLNPDYLAYHRDKFFKESDVDIK